MPTPRSSHVNLDSTEETPASHLVGCGPAHTTAAVGHPGVAARPRVARVTAAAPDQPEQPAHPSVARFRAQHAAAGGTGRLVELPAAAHTAALAAAALGCEVGAIANSLLFDADGRPLLVLTSGAHRVDVDLVAAGLGVSRLRRATPDFVREHTGQVIGGVSPLGHPSPVPTYVDRWLERHPGLWAAAGHPAWVFSTTFAELVALTGAAVVDVEATPSGTGA